MKKEAVQSLLHRMLIEIKDLWIKQLNSEGSNFDFDFEDIYRISNEGCFAVPEH